MAVVLNDGDVLTALSNKFGTKDFEIVAWKQLSLMEDGRLGNLGDHFKVEATVRRPASASETSNVSLFVKALPKNEQVRATVEKSGAFKKEALFYKLVAHEIAAALGGSRGKDFQHFVYPQCHLIKDDCLLFDDLSPFKFAGVEGRDPMPIEHVRLVVAALGELHAGSLVLEERRGRSVKELFPELDFETFFNDHPEHSNNTWHKASFKLCHDIVPHLDRCKGNEALIEKVRAAMPGLWVELFKAFHPWPGVRNVINHGDVWINNFMFRHAADGTPVEVSMVDFQLARICPPSNDLMIFLAFCTDKAMQETYLEELKKLHWDSIGKALRRAGCDPDKVLPWSEYDSVAKKMYRYAILLMALEQPFSLAPSSMMNPMLEDPEKFHHHCHVDRSETIIKLYHEDSLFHSRYNETMERIIDHYILKA